MTRLNQPIPGDEMWQEDTDNPGYLQYGTITEIRDGQPVVNWQGRVPGQKVSIQSSSPKLGILPLPTATPSGRPHLSSHQSRRERRRNRKRSR